MQVYRRETGATAVTPLAGMVLGMRLTVIDHAGETRLNHVEDHGSTRSIILVSPVLMWGFYYILNKTDQR